MREMVLPKNLFYEKQEIPAASLKSKQRWLKAFFIGAFLEICLVVIALVIGFLTFVGFLKSSSPANHLEFWLLIAILPIGGFAAHCLDKIADFNKSIRYGKAQERGFRKRDKQ